MPNGKGATIRFEETQKGVHTRLEFDSGKQIEDLDEDTVSNAEYIASGLAAVLTASEQYGFAIHEVLAMIEAQSQEALN